LTILIAIKYKRRPSSTESVWARSDEFSKHDSATWRTIM